jgi:arginine/ornithine transport system substrate-binding protein
MGSGSAQRTLFQHCLSKQTLCRRDCRSFIDLALGRNDAVLAEVAPARVSFLQTPLGADYEFVGPEITDERWFGTGIGIAVRKGDNARREALNRALAAMRTDGSYQKIIDRYFNSQ